MFIAISSKTPMAKMLGGPVQANDIKLSSPLSTRPDNLDQGIERPGGVISVVFPG